MLSFAGSLSAWSQFISKMFPSALHAKQYANKQKCKQGCQLESPYRIPSLPTVFTGGYRSNGTLAQWIRDQDILVQVLALCS